MEKDFGPANQEQSPDVSSLGWDTLKDVPNAIFNQTETIDNNESAEQEKAQGETEDQVELLLKNDLIECNEKFTRGERLACANLAEELSKSRLESLTNPVREFGEFSSRLDSERFSTLLEYLDQKFSPELSDQEKDKITGELRDAYFKDTMARAGLLAEETDTAWRSLNQMENEALAKPIHHVDKLRKEAPNSQVQIAKAYFDFFDNPTDKNRIILSHKVSDYTDSFRRELGGISEGLVDNKIGSKDLPDSIYLGLAQSVSKNYESMHDALLKYYNYKNNNKPNSVANSPKVELSSNAPDNTPQNTNQSPSSLPSDIF